jgi:hypothetical protein
MIDLSQAENAWNIGLLKDLLTHTARSALDISFAEIFTLFMV